MKVISSTDNKYLGMQVPEISVGDTVALKDYTFEVQFIRMLENGNLLVGNPNYQFELSQE
jgi:hypothetical protein